MNVKRMSVPICVVFVFVLCMSVSAVGAVDCTCGDICVNTTGWWRAGGTFNASETPIQAAVDFAAEGDTICVKDGTYTENVNVDKRLSLRGEGAVTVNAVSSSEHVFSVTADYVDISGFLVAGATGGWNAGICLNAVNRCNISGNNASNNRNGIYLKSSSNCTLKSNTASGNGWYGIYLDSSSNNNIMNNTVDLNDYGIYLDSPINKSSTDNMVSGNDEFIWLEFSSNNVLTDNTIMGNKYGIALRISSNNSLTGNIMSGNDYNTYVYGYNLSHFIQNIDTSNLVNGKPVYYWVGQQNKQVPDDAGFVGIVNSTNVTVSDLTLTNNRMGVLFAYTNNSRIENVTASSNYNGIYLYSSGSNNITGNTASNSKTGIHMERSSNSTLTNNTLHSNDSGIHLESSNYILIRNNTIESTGECGIYSSYSDNNTYENNTISGSMRVRLSNPSLHQPLPLNIRIASLTEINVVQGEHIQFQPHAFQYFS